MSINASPNQNRMSGVVRVDERPQRLLSRLQPGEVAVIDQPDFDRRTALLLIECRPRVVLNAAPSTTGRISNLGPHTLVEAGIALIDDLGADVMTLREGESVHVIGNQVFRGDQLVAAGNIRTLTDLASAHDDSGHRLSLQVEAFAKGTEAFFDSESALLLNNQGIPPLKKSCEGRQTLVILPGSETGSALRSLKRYARDFSPIYVAVESGADILMAGGRRPDLIVGDVSALQEKTLRCGAELVLLQRADGTIPGSEKADNYGLDYSVIPTSVNAEEAAILLADAAGAATIITVGPDLTLERLFDEERAALSGSFFVRLRTSNKLASWKVISSIYRPRISIWSLVLVLLAALLVVFAAIAFTPWGADATVGIGNWLQELWPFSGPADPLSTPGSV